MLWYCISIILCVCTYRGMPENSHVFPGPPWVMYTVVSDSCRVTPLVVYSAHKWRHQIWPSFYCLYCFQKQRPSLLSTTTTTDNTRPETHRFAPFRRWITTKQKHQSDRYLKLPMRVYILQYYRVYRETLLLMDTCTFTKWGWNVAQNLSWKFQLFYIRRM